jgi:hypothetical protein
MASLAGLGAFANGLAGGLQRGQQINLASQQMERQKKSDDQADALQRDLTAANRAGSDYLSALRAEHEKANAGQPWQPTNEQILAAGQARTNKLFELGRTDAALKQWSQDEGLRAGLRRRAVEQGMLDYRASGDPTSLLKGVYSHIDDGWDIDGVTTSKGLDGSVRFNVSRRNQRTGATDTHTLEPKHIDGIAQFAMDPEQAAKYALMEKLAGYKVDRAIEAGGKKHEQTMEQIGARAEGNLAVAETRADAARDVANTRATATVTAAQIRGAAKGGGKDAGSTVQRTIVQDDGSVVAIMKDGSRKVMTKDDGTPMRSIEAEKLVSSVSKEVGKSLDALGATPEKNRQRARDMLPKPPKQLTGLPAGAKQIGTSGGKPVYQTPDGKKFIKND